ncbi:hypothetical protein [Stieleria mannarensis]|uniref:hypothetical protein n=1 Tax=Stieleria mannarensis TaxID=2755585 RepID=UPI0015FFF07F|nr:hypothetical protein [Rhodopirellula sp. JC639]
MPNSPVFRFPLAFRRFGPDPAAADLARALNRAARGGIYTGVDGVSAALGYPPRPRSSGHVDFAGTDRTAESD